jgi:hypothetical protein
MKRLFTVLIMLLIPVLAAAQVPSGAAVTGTEGDLHSLILKRNADNSVDCFFVVMSRDVGREEVAAPTWCTNNSVTVAAFAKAAIESYQTSPYVDPTVTRMVAYLESIGYTVTSP